MKQKFYRMEEETKSSKCSFCKPVLLFLAFLGFCKESQLFYPSAEIYLTSSALPRKLLHFSWFAFFQRFVDISHSLLSSFPFSLWVFYSFIIIPFFFFNTHYFGRIGQGNRDKDMFSLPCLTGSPWGFAFRPPFNAIVFVQGNSCFKRREKNTHFSFWPCHWL